MQRKIAIVGANGFVGRHLLQLVIPQGIDAVGVVRSESGAATVRGLGGKPIQLEDLREGSTAALASQLAGCEALVYTASVSSAAGAVDRTQPSGLVNVLAACRGAGIPRFVFFSGLGIAHYGMNPHCTNPYFLAKMAGEVELFRSEFVVTVFRPSYIFGAGDEFLSPLIARLAAESEIEIPGEGRYRLQPISVRDAARAIMGAVDSAAASPRVVDLVGPEILSYRTLVARIAAAMGRAITMRERPVEEALAQARQSGYFGLKPHDLACLLCDEVSDARSAEALVGARLEGLDEMIDRTIRAFRPSRTSA
jgi:nucleoside-diphosphate-sugar epimerase